MLFLLPPFKLGCHCKSFRVNMDNKKKTQFWSQITMCKISPDLILDKEKLEGKSELRLTLWYHD